MFTFRHEAQSALCTARTLPILLQFPVRSLNHAQFRSHLPPIPPSIPLPILELAVVITGTSPTWDFWIQDMEIGLFFNPPSFLVYEILYRLDYYGSMVCKAKTAVCYKLYLYIGATPSSGSGNLSLFGFLWPCLNPVVRCS
jgi:hypothetical protein